MQHVTALAEWAVQVDAWLHKHAADRAAFLAEAREARGRLAIAWMKGMWPQLVESRCDFVWFGTTPEDGSGGNLTTVVQHGFVDVTLEVRATAEGKRILWRDTNEPFYWPPAAAQTLRVGFQCCPDHQLLTAGAPYCTIAASDCGDDVEEWTCMQVPASIHRPAGKAPDLLGSGELKTWAAKVAAASAQTCVWIGPWHMLDTSGLRVARSWKIAYDVTCHHAYDPAGEVDMATVRPVGVSCTSFGDADCAEEDPVSRAAAQAFLDVADLEYLVCAAGCNLEYEPRDDRAYREGWWRCWDVEVTEFDAAD